MYSEIARRIFTHESRRWACVAAFFFFFCRLLHMNQGGCWVFLPPNALEPDVCVSGTLPSRPALTRASLTNVQTTVQPLLPEQVV